MNDPARRPAGRARRRPPGEGDRAAARCGLDADDVERHMVDKRAVEEVVAAIKERHSRVAAYMPSLVGHRIQKIESDIMVRAMLDLIDKVIVPLPFA